MKGETNMSGTIWALVPPIVAIALALWTKEVYLSLLIGILSGALLFTKFHILAATQTMIEVMNWKIGDNVNILLFLVFLGIIVALITKSGASQSYGDWASRKIKSQRGALFSNHAPRRSHLCGRLLQLPDRGNRYAPGHRQIQSKPRKTGLHHRRHSSTGLYHRTDLKHGRQP